MLLIYNINMENEKQIIKNGFTLIELLVSIALVASLSITVGLGVNMLIKKSKLDKNVAALKDVMNAASVFCELSDNGICTKGSDCTITINDLIYRGLLEKSIVNEKNPMYIDKNFMYNDEIEIKYQNKEKKVIYKCGSRSVNLNNIDDYKDWEKC